MKSCSIEVQEQQSYAAMMPTVNTRSSSIQSRSTVVDFPPDADSNGRRNYEAMMAVARTARKDSSSVVLSVGLGEALVLRLFDN